MPRKDRHNLTIDNEELNMDETNFICVLYLEYCYEDRPLMLEEIYGIIGLKRGKAPPNYQNMKGIIRKLDDPQSSLVREFNKRFSSFSEKEKHDLLDEIKESHSELRGKNEIFDDIANNLSGLKKRLPSYPLRNIPTWNGKNLRFDQLFLIYPIPNLCRDHNGGPLHDEYCHAIAEQLLGKARNNRIIRVLQDPSKETTSLLVKGMRDRDIAQFFTEKARRTHLNYTIEANLPPPSTLPLPRAETPTESIARVSHAMEISSIGVTAGPWQQGVAYEDLEESPSPDPEPRTRRRRFEEDFPRRQRTGASSSGVPASTAHQPPLSYSGHQYVPPTDTLRPLRPEGQQQSQDLASSSALTSNASNSYGSTNVSNPYGPPNSSNPNVSHHTISGQGRIQQEPGMDNRHPSDVYPFFKLPSQGRSSTDVKEARRLQSKPDQTMEAENKEKKRKQEGEEAKAEKAKKETERKRKRDAGKKR